MNQKRHTNTTTSISVQVLMGLFFILFSLSASASSTWENFGNQMQIYGSLQNNFFSSNFPQGNINFTIVNIAQGSDYTPIIDDLDRNGQNEIYIFKGQSIYQYDNYGNLIKQITLNSTLCGTPFIYNQGSDLDSEMFLVTYRSGTIYDFWKLGITEGLLQVEFYDSIDKGQSMFCTVSAKDVSSTDFYLVMNNNSIFHYIEPTNQYEVIGNPTALASFTPKRSQYLNFKYDNAYGDIDKDGNLELGYVAQGTTTNERQVLFDVVTQTYTVVTSVVNGVAANNASLFFVNIGINASEREVLYYNRGVGASSYYAVLFDSTLGNEFDINNAGGVSVTALPVVGDYNKDGLNDLCLMNTTHWFCYDYSHTKYVTHKFNGTPTQNTFMAIGEYSDDHDSYMEILLTDGIWRYNSNLTEITKIYNFTDTDTYMMLPVAIQQKATFVKDLLIASSTKLYMYVASGQASQCGNQICESGETVYNCESDCFLGLPQNMTVGFIPNTATCSENADCLSRLCEGFICVGKPAGSSCTVDGECASNDCDQATYTCSRTDVKQSIDTTVDLLGFRSTASKMLLALLIIVAFTVGGVVTGAKAAGAMGGFLAGIVGFVASLFISILVFGWLGVWVVFMVTFLVIALVGLVIYLFSSVAPGG